MAIVSGDELIVIVFENNSGGITIQQIDCEHGGGAMVAIGKYDVDGLIEALRLFSIAEGDHA